MAAGTATDALEDSQRSPRGRRGCRRAARPIDCGRCRAGAMEARYARDHRHLLEKPKIVGMRVGCGFRPVHGRAVHDGSSDVGDRAGFPRHLCTTLVGSRRSYPNRRAAARWVLGAAGRTRRGGAPGCQGVAGQPQITRSRSPDRDRQIEITRSPDHPIIRSRDCLTPASSHPAAARRRCPAPAAPTSRRSAACRACR